MDFDKIITSSPVNLNIWQPAETAPKDGTLIDIWVLAKFKWEKPKRVCDVKWYYQDDIWNGWIIGHGNGPHDYYPNLIREKFVTHWMPSPTPPHITAAENQIPELSKKHKLRGRKPKRR